MYYILGKQRVADLTAWKSVIAADNEAHAEAGLHFRHVWSAINDPHQIFFLFSVEDPDRARVFLDKAGALDHEKQGRGEIPELTFVSEK